MKPPTAWQLAALATGTHLALIAFNRKERRKNKNIQPIPLAPRILALSLITTAQARAEAAYNAFTAALPGDHPSWTEFIRSEPHRRYLTPLLHAAQAALKPL